MNFDLLLVVGRSQIGRIRYTGNKPRLHEDFSRSCATRKRSPRLSTQSIGSRSATSRDPHRETLGVPALAANEYFCLAPKPLVRWLLQLAKWPATERW
jgi:hypothetical protein